MVIVNEALARKYWPGEDPLGRRFKWGSPTSTAPYMEIVGVVADPVQGKLNEPPLPAVYIPYRQLAAERVSGLGRTMTIVMRAETDVDTLASVIRREVRSLDPELPVFGLRTLRDALAASESERRFLAFLVAIFAVTAALLAAAGLVGVVGRMVSLSRREIGIRIALGARSSAVVRRNVLEGINLAISGVVLGVAASLFLTGTLSSQLYAVGPQDPRSAFGGGPPRRSPGLDRGLSPRSSGPRASTPWRLCAASETDFPALRILKSQFQILRHHRPAR